MLWVTCDVVRCKARVDINPSLAVERIILIVDGMRARGWYCEIEPKSLGSCPQLHSYCPRHTEEGHRRHADLEREMAARRKEVMR